MQHASHHCGLWLWQVAAAGDRKACDAPAPAQALHGLHEAGVPLGPSRAEPLMLQTHPLLSLPCHAATCGSITSSKHALPTAERDTCMIGSTQSCAPKRSHALHPSEKSLREPERCTPASASAPASHLR